MRGARSGTPLTRRARHAASPGGKAAAVSTPCCQNTDGLTLLRAVQAASWQSMQPLQFNSLQAQHMVFPTALLTTSSCRLQTQGCSRARARRA